MDLTGVVFGPGRCPKCHDYLLADHDCESWRRAAERLRELLQGPAAPEKGTSMIPVKLFAKGGGFVANVTIPPFNEPPDILLWGTRCFVYDDAATKDAEPPLHYTEAFYYAIPDTALIPEHLKLRSPS